MPKIRFNIANLLVIIFILGVGFAALRESNDLWQSGLFTLTLSVLLVSILLAIHRTESRRALWIGFALFGSIYLGLSLVPSIESRLITTKTLTYLDSIVPGRYLRIWTFDVSVAGSGSSNVQVQNVAVLEDHTQPSTSIPGQWRIWNVATGKSFGGRGGTKENFVRIGHSLFALLVGWLGGLLSRRFLRASRMPGLSTSIEMERLNP
jgi:hypothetical protein